MVAAKPPIMAKLNVIFKVRMCDHLGILTLTGKRVNSDDNSVIEEHLLFLNDTPDFEYSSIFVINYNNFKVTLMESFLINRDHLPSNKNRQSLPSELFDSQGIKFPDIISCEIDSFCCSSFILKVALLSNEFYI